MGSCRLRYSVDLRIGSLATSKHLPTFRHLSTPFAVFIFQACVCNVRSSICGFLRDRLQKCGFSKRTAFNLVDEDAYFTLCWDKEERCLSFKLVTEFIRKRSDDEAFLSDMLSHPTIACVFQLDDSGRVRPADRVGEEDLVLTANKKSNEVTMSACLSDAEGVFCHWRRRSVVRTDCVELCFYCFSCQSWCHSEILPLVFPKWLVLLTCGGWHFMLNCPIQTRYLRSK